MVLQMLNILEHFDLVAMGHNSPEMIRCLAEAMKIATVDKENSVGDPKFVDVPTAHLISKEYAEQMAAKEEALQNAVTDRQGRLADPHFSQAGRGSGCS